jgi:hypothetical protein
MTDPIAMPGDYVDLKFIQGRKVARVVVEIPIEFANKFIAGFGTPDAANPVRVAIARLVNPGPDSGSTPLRTPDAETKCQDKSRHWNDLSAAAQAGIRSHDPEFQRWAGIQADLCGTSYAQEQTAQIIRAHCKVASRREFSESPEAAKLWRSMDTDFSVRGILR